MVKLVEKMGDDGIPIRTEYETESTATPTWNKRNKIAKADSLEAKGHASEK